MAEIPLPTPTNNDVPSTDIRDAVYAGAMLDKAMTSAELSYVDRLGGQRMTFAGFEKKANDSIAELQEHADQQIDNIAHSAAASQAVVSASAQAAIQDINSTVTQTANDAAIVLAGLGYLPPVPYVSGLSVSSSRFTVTYNGNTYAAVADQLP
ncbi:TPA: hypothetical protein ACXPJO_001856, partial [Klebsiella pneumoniae]